MEKSKRTLILELRKHETPCATILIRWSASPLKKLRNPNIPVALNTDTDSYLSWKGIYENYGQIKFVLLQRFVCILKKCIYEYKAQARITTLQICSLYTKTSSKTLGRSSSTFDKFCYKGDVLQRYSHWQKSDHNFFLNDLSVQIPIPLSKRITCDTKKTHTKNKKKTTEESYYSVTVIIRGQLITTPLQSKQPSLNCQKQT